MEAFCRTKPDNAEALTKLALLMLAMPEASERQPDLAVKAARLAYEADSQTAETAQAVAQVYFEIGDVDTAVAFQRRAVAAANILDLEAARDVLKFFETCKSLHAKGTPG